MPCTYEHLTNDAQEMLVTNMRDWRRLNDDVVAMNTYIQYKSFLKNKNKKSVDNSKKIFNVQFSMYNQFSN